jgi:hypothetical protein
MSNAGLAPTGEPAMTDDTIGNEDFITIVGADIAEITREFHAQGLSERQFSIVNRVGRHRFTMAGGEGSQAMFGGLPLMAATFARHK